MQIVPGTQSFGGQGITTLRIEGIEDVVVHDYMLRFPYKRVQNLLDKIQLFKADKFEGSMGMARDNEGNTWQIVVPADVRKEWTPAVKKNAYDIRADVKDYREPALLVAELMLGYYAVLETNTENEEELEAGGGAVYRQFRLFRNLRSGIKPEVDVSSMFVGVDEMQVILYYMSCCEGVKHIRRVVGFSDERGSVYENQDGDTIRTKIRKDEVPQFEITVPKKKLAEKYVKPVIGERAYNLLCMAFFYTVLAEPQGYFILSDDGGTGKSTLLNGFSDFFRGIVARGVSFTNLAKGDFAQGAEYQKLIGKSIAFVDEASQIRENQTEYLNGITTGCQTTARWHGGSLSFWCQSWMFLATNKPDQLPNIDSTNRRRVTITLNRPEAGQWGEKVVNASGESVKRFKFAKSPECIREMFATGRDLILERQKQGLDAFEGLSMDDTANAVNAVEERDEETLALARALHQDPAAIAFMAGDDSSRKTEIAAANVIRNMRNRGTFFVNHGINPNKLRGKKQGDTRPYVLYLTNREKLRELWDMVQDETPSAQEVEQLGKVLQYNGDEMQYNSAEHNDVAVEVNRKIQSKLGPDYEVSLKMRGRKPWLLITKNNTVLADLHLLCMNSEKPQPGEDAIRIRPYGETTVYMSDEPGKNAPGLLIQRIRNGEAIGHRKA